MHIVVIYNWPEVTTELAQSLAAIMQVTAFDSRQRLVGKGPAVIGSFAQLCQAQELLVKLKDAGFVAFVIDSDAEQKKERPLVVRRFKLADEKLHLEIVGGTKGNIPYSNIDFLMPASRITQQSETQTVTEKKFSIGKTLVAGGLPMKSKTERKEVVSSEENERVLYLCVGGNPRVLFPQNHLVYTGLGAEMKPSREMNFNFLISELRRRCSAVNYDDRMLSRTEQVKLLGPILLPETYLELAVTIMAKAASVKG